MKISSGFSLAESIVVLAMLVVFAGLTAAITTPAIRNAEFDRVRETVRNELVAAQADTIGGTLDSSWGVAFSSNAVTRYKGASYAARDTAFDRVTSFGNAVILSGTSDVTFTRPAGLPSVSAAIAISADSLHATTTVNTAGAIDVQ